MDRLATVAYAVGGSETLVCREVGLKPWRFTFDIAASRNDNTASVETSGSGASSFKVCVGREAANCRQCIPMKKGDYLVEGKENSDAPS